MSSSNQIKAIDRHSVHRICSGQVVLSMAVAAKELVENSIDAGATIVDVRLKDYGVSAIEVADNGGGIEPENYEALTLKHHTSKIRDFSDLMEIESFGFRGEALSSLCALGKLTVVTRTAGQEAGMRIEYDIDGKILTQEPTPREVGTTVMITDLFSRLPVRHKQLHKNVKKEYAKLLQIIQAYCIISTGVRINCSNQNATSARQKVLATNGNDDLRQNFINIFGAKQASQLATFEPTAAEGSAPPAGCAVTGLISKVIPSGCGRSSADRQFFFVNNRPCDHSKFSKLVNDIYRQYNHNQYPVVVFNVTTGKDACDINVTPDKRTIYLHNENAILEHVKASLQAMFEPSRYTYEMKNASLEGFVVRSKPAEGEGDDVAAIEQHAEEGVGEVGEDGDEGPRDEQVASVGSDADQEAQAGVRTVDVAVDGPGDDDDAIQGQSVCEAEAEAGAQVSPVRMQERPSPTSAPVLEGRRSTRTVTRATSFSEDMVDDTAEMSEHECSHSHDDDDPPLPVPIMEAATASKRSISMRVTAHSDEPEGSCHEVTPKKKRKTRTVFVMDEPAALRGDGNSVNGVEQEVSLGLDKLRSRLERHLNSESKGDERSKLANRFRAQITPKDNENAEAELNKVFSKESFSKMVVHGQFNLGFIIASLDDQLFIVDQHATDEKYNFETLQRTTRVQSQRLIVPKQLDLTAPQEAILLDHVDVFEQNGFEFVVNDSLPPGRRVALTTIPHSKNTVFGVEDVDELIFMLSESPNTMCRPSRVRKMFAMRACRSSVMVGTALSKDRMQKLLRHMGEIEQPWNCPHGRPTMRHLVDLSMFQRSGTPSDI